MGKDELQAKLNLKGQEFDKILLDLGSLTFQWYQEIVKRSSKLSQLQAEAQKIMRKMPQLPPIPPSNQPTPPINEPK